MEPHGPATEPEWQRVARAWPGLSAAVRRKILALVEETTDC
jgi:hypothetical protein